ncbi:translation initiation factor IF-2-like [Manacus candei]|uniref:translation initiation factor IF-2-like n=1 Tax=Manacus candei TaxID=415023 RepID=UPI0022264A77|nr:translation initiation factor IF-2-like [Manacus candei]
MAAAGRGAGARSPHKLLANSVPASWRPTARAAASAPRGERGKRGDQTTTPTSPRPGAVCGSPEKQLPAQARRGGTRTRHPPASPRQRPPRTGAAPQPGGGFSTATTGPSRRSRPRPARPMADPAPPLPVAQGHVHQHSRASFPLRPPPFPHHPPSQPSLAARALVSQRRDDVRHSGVHIRRRLKPGCRDSGGRGGRWDGGIPGFLRHARPPARVRSVGLRRSEATRPVFTAVALMSHE